MIVKETDLVKITLIDFFYFNYGVYMKFCHCCDLLIYSWPLWKSYIKLFISRNPFFWSCRSFLLPKILKRDHFLVFIIFGWNFCYYYISNGYLRCITLWSVLTIRKTECRNEVFSIWFAVKCKPMKNKRLRIHSVLNLFAVFVSVWRAGWAVQKTINYGEYLCYCTLRELLKIRPHEVKLYQASLTLIRQPCSKNNPCQKDHNNSSIDFVDFIPLFFECNESILSPQLPLVLAQ